MSFQICIDVSNLTKRYKNAEEDSLKKVSFHIREGEKFGILGPNGAGKTTLISVLCGIFPQSSGNFSFSLSGQPLDRKSRRKTIGFVPQEYAFYEDLTPIQNMEYFGSLYGISKKDIHLRSDTIFSVLGLTKLTHKKTKIFSGGQKRRMNLAIGVIHNPKILFVDEPTVGADVQSKHAMIGYLNALNEQGTTIVYTSHHMSEAQEFCHRIAFISNGLLIACDDVDVLLNKHDAKDLTSLFIQLTGEGYSDEGE